MSSLNPKIVLQTLSFDLRCPEVHFQGFVNAFRAVSTLLMLLAPVPSFGPSCNKAGAQYRPDTRESHCQCFNLVSRAPSLENAFRAASALLVRRPTPEALIELSNPPTQPKCIFQGMAELTWPSFQQFWSSMPSLDPKIVLQMFLGLVSRAPKCNCQALEAHLELFQLCLCPSLRTQTELPKLQTKPKCHGLPNVFGLGFNKSGAQCLNASTFFPMPHDAFVTAWKQHFELFQLCWCSWPQSPNRNRADDSDQPQVQFQRPAACIWP